MASKSIDTKLARRLQKRGAYSCYMKCLAAVRKVLMETDKTPKEVAAMIDAGELDPK